MISKYKEIQRGGIFLTSILTTIVLLLLAYRYQWTESPLSIEIFMSLFILFCVVLLLFYKLQTEIYNGEIRLSFGMGLIQKSIDLSKVESAEVVRNKWYYGLGIRFYGKGWMWNYKGLDAVEIQYKESRKKFRIGSCNPGELQKIISENLL